MRSRALPPLLAAASALALATIVQAPPALAQTSFAPCAQPAGFSCVAVTVPLDRSGRLAGTIALSVERRTSAAGQSPVAVVALAGGPGQATLPLAPFIAEAVAPALATRDLLLFDQRGTGSSGPLSCSALNAPEISAVGSVGEVIERCARQLGPARGSYTTLETVEDIDAVRRAAGYEKLVLYGTSYGTKVALEYAARHPQNVAGLVLDSTETAEGPEPFHVGTFRAIRPMLRELCAHRACSAISANPLGDLARLVAATVAHPLSGVAYDSRGRSFKLSITSRDLFGLLLDGDLNPALRAEMPAAVRAALLHDPAPLARILALNSLHPSHEEASSSIDETLFIDTSCEETAFPWKRSSPEGTRAVEAEAALNTLPSSDFYPFGPEAALLDMTIPLCVSWPDAAAAPPSTPSEPNVPTLILSGGQDLRTPTENAQQVASLIPDAVLLKVPYTGHSVLGSDLSGCAKAALGAFFVGQPVQSCSAVRNPFPPAPLAPERLSSVPAARGVPAAQSRTLTAVVDSLRDLRRTVTQVALDFGEMPVGVPFGGLHGGVVEMTAAGIELRRLAYVRGVTLTGLVPTSLLFKGTGANAQLTIAGSAAAAGRLTVAPNGHISGQLAGRSVSFNAARHAQAASALAAHGAGAGGIAGEAGTNGGAPLSLPLPRLARLR